MPIADTVLFHPPYPVPPARDRSAYEQPYEPSANSGDWFEDRPSATSMSREVAKAADLNEYLVSLYRPTSATQFSAGRFSAAGESLKARGSTIGEATVLGQEPHRQSNDIRIQLLERKHLKGGLSDDEAARLRILTDRVRKLIPAFGEDAISSLESVAEAIETAKARHAKVLQELLG